MQRVVVIGCGGAGKSTFARELAARTGLPLVHLDRLYWQPGWTPTPAEEWKAIVRDVVAEERRLVDGNYGGTVELRLERADTAIFLDVPRRTCLRRVFVRALRSRGRLHDDLGPGCREKLPNGTSCAGSGRIRRDSDRRRSRCSPASSGAEGTPSCCATTPMRRHSSTPRPQNPPRLASMPQ